MQDFEPAVLFLLLLLLLLLLILLQLVHSSLGDGNTGPASVSLLIY